MSNPHQWDCTCLDCHMSRVDEALWGICEHEWVRQAAEPDLGQFTEFEECAKCGDTRNLVIEGR
jgi:hypothetical protein